MEKVVGGWPWDQCMHTSYKMEFLKDLGLSTTFDVDDFSPYMKTGESSSLRTNFCQTGEYDGDVGLKGAPNGNQGPIRAQEMFKGVIDDGDQG